jgi:hypothetical protein
MNSFFPLLSGSADEKKYYLESLLKSGMPKRRLSVIHKLLWENRKKFVDIFIDSGQVLDGGTVKKNVLSNKSVAVFVTLSANQVKEMHDLKNLCDYMFISDRVYMDQPTVGYIFKYKEPRKRKPIKRR